MVAPLQGYLDGYCVKQGVVRQFVAMPLGSGYPAEEQATGEAEYDGCLRILVCPMKLEVFERRFSKLTWDEYWGIGAAKKRLCYCRPMEVAHGSRIRQHLYEDPYELSAWDTEHVSRCFVRIVNSKEWRSITGEKPPRIGLTASQYARLNLPWLKSYEKKRVALSNGIILSALKELLKEAFGLDKKQRERAAEIRCGLRHLHQWRRAHRGCCRAGRPGAGDSAEAGRRCGTVQRGQGAFSCVHGGGR